MPLVPLFPGRVTCQTWSPGSWGRAVSLVAVQASDTVQGGAEDWMHRTP